MKKFSSLFFGTQKFLYLVLKCLLLDHLEIYESNPQTFGIELQYYPSCKRYMFYCSGSFFMHINVTAHIAPSSLLLTGLYVLTIHLFDHMVLAWCVLISFAFMPVIPLADLTVTAYFNINKLWNVIICFILHWSVFGWRHNRICNQITTLSTYQVVSDTSITVWWLAHLLHVWDAKNPAILAEKFRGFSQLLQEAARYFQVGLPSTSFPTYHSWSLCWMLYNLQLEGTVKWLKYLKCHAVI